MTIPTEQSFVDRIAKGLILDGKATARTIREEVQVEVAKLVAGGHRAPTLATVLVGDDPASVIYVEAKHAACDEVGIRSIDRRLPADATAPRVAQLLKELNQDGDVDGVLLQLPLPDGLEARSLVDLIDPAKDVDGLTSLNVGSLWRREPGLVPCTPLGVLQLLLRHDVPIGGREAVIVGRSDLVGRPLAALLIDLDATVTVAHRSSEDLPSICRRADILVAAAGVPGLIGSSHVKEDAVVVDVGISRTDHGIVGDVDFDAVRGRTSAITPVPGGVGPMTIAALLSNTLRARQKRRADVGSSREGSLAAEVGNFGSPATCDY